MTVQMIRRVLSDWFARRISYTCRDQATNEA